MTTHLVTTLKRKATQILAEAKTTRTPILITEYGKPSAYIVDAQTFQETREKIAILEGIARGEKDIREARTLTNDQALRRFRKWLK